MTKFSAQKLTDFFTTESKVDRLVRGVKYVVATEASDGSWCEFDADDEAHARVLAQNAVDKLGARGCSCWRVTADGSYERGPSFFNYYWQPEAA